jgi:diguanylate cyclase (GGDEF)-like protein
LTGVKTQPPLRMILGPMALDFLELAWPRRDSELTDRHRADTVARRVASFAQLFAILTLAWTAVDAVAFEAGVVARLFALRLAASAAFFALALASRGTVTALRRAQATLLALFAIPALLYLAASRIVSDGSRGGIEAIAVSFYSVVPFALAAGIAAFPLTAMESAALATIALIAEGWGIASGTLHADAIVPLGSFWLLAVIAIVASFSALSQLRLHEELVRQAMRDPLTGCHRRESGKELLEVQFLIAARHATPLAVLFADLDRFKQVNDRWGHEEGDRVLATAAAALRRMMRESDIVLRWGGEEFVVVLPHTTRGEAVALLDRLRTQGVGVLPDGRPVTLSIGIAELRADGARDADELVEIADRRMYRAKQAGRNRYAEGEAEPSPLLVTPTAISSR